MVSGTWGAKLSPNPVWVCRAAAYFVSLCVCATYLYHLAAGSSAYLGLLEDDYFYYAIIADKLNTLGKLSFDGVHLTNGFHPLWFALVALLRAVAGRFGIAYYAGLIGMFFVSMCACFELCRRFATRLGASPALAAAIAVVYSLGTARLFAMGMECVIAVPLFLWFLCEVAEDKPLTLRRAAALGLLASLAILARLDLALAVGLVVAGYGFSARPGLRHGLRLLAAFAAGGALLPIYAAANAAKFGSPFPMSMQAKRMLTHWGFGLGYGRQLAFESVFGPTVGIVMAFGLLAWLLLWRERKYERPAAMLAGGAAILFTFVFIVVNTVPGWIFFWWYAYPFTAGTVAALCFICQRWAPLLPEYARRGIAAFVVALVPALGARYFLQHGPGWSLVDDSLLNMSVELKERLGERRGLLAMGAVAGIATFVLDRPVLQLEGLVTDARLLEHLERQDPLGDVLSEYQADYLVVTLATVRPDRSDGCYLVTQPHAEWAGKRSRKMRGEICAEPIEHFFTPRGPHDYSMFPPLETLVWDLRGARWRNPRE